MTSKKSQRKSPATTMSDKKESSNTLIIVAIIGLIGVVVTATFGYLGTLATSTGKEISLSAAQSDWLSLIDFQFGWGAASCGQQVSSVVPDYITLKENDRISLTNMENISDKAPVAPWPGSNQEMQWGITITNKSSNTGDWIRIDKQMKVKLNVISTDVSKHVSLWKPVGQGCGGGDYKYFSPIKLNQDKNSLYQTTTADKYDYFSFQPGEFDTFAFDFVCAAPGLYRPTIEMKVSYKGQNKTVNIMGNDLILCPKTFSLWFTDIGYYVGESLATTESIPIYKSPMSYSGEFIWNGTKYEEVNP